MSLAAFRARLMFERDPATARLRGALRRGAALRRRMHGAMRRADGKRIPWYVPEEVRIDARRALAQLGGF